MAKKTMRERMLSASKSDTAGFFDEGDYGKIRDYIDTGNVLMNCMLSADPDKGFPSGKIIQFAGPESVGKTFICLETVKAAQRAGYFIVYYDSEMANDAEGIIARGLDPASFLYVPVATVEELTTSLINILDEADPKEKLMVVVDSLGNLSTRKELQDSTDGSEKRDMTRAQKLRALFRTCTIKAGIKNVPFAAVNHVYAAVGCVPAGTEVILSNGFIDVIENIKVGDTVKTLLGDRKVLETYEYDAMETFTVTLEDGSEITATPNHKFLTEDFEWKCMEDLEEGDSIVALSSVSYIK